MAKSAISRRLLGIFPRGLRRRMAETLSFKAVQTASESVHNQGSYGPKTDTAKVAKRTQLFLRKEIQRGVPTSRLEQVAVLWVKIFWGKSGNVWSPVVRAHLELSNAPIGV